MKILKLHILPLLLVLLSLPTASAQVTDSIEAGLDINGIRQALKTFESKYRPEAYRPMKPMLCDSIKIDEELKRINIFFNEAFSAQTFTPEMIGNIRSDISELMPADARPYSIGLYGFDGRRLEDFVPNYVRHAGIDSLRLWRDLSYDGEPWVRNISHKVQPTKGLAGKHLFVTPSHGRYYKNAKNDWYWQRPYLFCTTEDLFTQSVVNPFLIPMLEKAGAIVFSARERDYQTEEAIVDNDTTGSAGTYTETFTEGQPWQSMGEGSGFAIPTAWLVDSDQPFKAGTARFCATTTTSMPTASASWRPEIPKSGDYAVYVSYSKHPDNIPDAHYTIFHSGGKTEFCVNQQMGAGTWVYLGTFHFAKGSSAEGEVVLDNLSTQEGVVSADAVRFGGGRGRNVRGTLPPTGMPRHLEGARCYTQWAGLPDSLYNEYKGENDYNDDIRCRSNMLNWLGGGSVFMPGKEGGKVPFELSLAVHSDAGFRHDNSIYGTMGLCTTKSGDGQRFYPAGISRQASADLARIMVSTVQRDLSAKFGTTWIRREVWDRNYGESRMPDVPSMILETLSHQNFTDLRMGHDPNFKFTLARAIYKGLLRFANNMHDNKDVVVQPLPVNSFSALLNDTASKAVLTWKPTNDELEPTATPTHYIIYMRKDNGGFDNGTKSITPSAEISIKPGVRYAFRITAVNSGGESLPSEELSVYLAENSRGKVLIVNGFNRVSGPAYTLNDKKAGFLLEEDWGVAWGTNSSYCGVQKCFDRKQEGKEGPGALGHSGMELMGKYIQGNTFDYTSVHGEAIAAEGNVSYVSASKLAAKELDWSAFDAIDYICGLERDVKWNLLPYKTFDKDIRKKMSAYHGGILVSGAFIGSDMQSKEEKEFTHKILKYDFHKSIPYDKGCIEGLRLMLPLEGEIDHDSYALQYCDVITPANDDAFAAFAYSDLLPAGVAYAGKNRRTISMGFPFETIQEAGLRAKAMHAILNFLITK